MAHRTIAQRIERIFEECSGVWGTSNVTSWERSRLDEWRGRAELAPGQVKILEQIEQKVFGEDNG